MSHNVRVEHNNISRRKKERGEGDVYARNKWQSWSLLRDGRNWSLKRRTFLQILLTLTNFLEEDKGWMGMQLVIQLIMYIIYSLYPHTIIWNGPIIKLHEINSDNFIQLQRCFTQTLIIILFIVPNHSLITAEQTNNWQIQLLSSFPGLGKSNKPQISIWRNKISCIIGSDCKWTVEPININFLPITYEVCINSYVDTGTQTLK